MSKPLPDGHIAREVPIDSYVVLINGDNGLKTWRAFDSRDRAVQMMGRYEPGKAMIVKVSQVRYEN